ncbi:MAG: septal ring lytic transglycosylase RlpA family protein [Pseudomonadales bacterium]|nr:septal ring lytic transglycosylase RlpA family protein [Pseudomonadales bacterium]
MDTFRIIDIKPLIFAVLSMILLQACTTSRYSMDKDAAPESGFDASNIPDAIPKHEKRTIAGNKSPYTILGKTYHVLDTEKGYRETGMGSWYGKKFHGYHTSNGEVYNMYKMTAAHKTLPIPSYVQVKNLDNGRTIVVRINDRGPFHEGRIIDLSYAAAQKLGYADKGTARVEVTALVPDAPTVVDKAGSVNRAELLIGYYVQLGAYSSRESAMRLQQQAQSLLGTPVFLAELNETGAPVYRVRVGPFLQREEANQKRLKLLEHQLGQPIVLTRPLAAEDLASVPVAKTEK